MKSKFRCPKCGRFFGNVEFSGLIELKCANCKSWITLEVKEDKGKQEDSIKGVEKNESIK